MSTVVNVGPQLKELANLVSDTTYIIPDGIYNPSVTKLGAMMVVMNGNNITVKAQTRGNVVFTTGNISFVMSGNNNILDGIQFVNTSAFMGSLPPNLTSLNSSDLITVNGHDNTVSFVNINKVLARHFVNVYGKAQRFTMNNCNIQNKTMEPRGGYINSMVQLQGDPNTTNKHHIYRCTWQRMKGDGGHMGCEPLRIGDTAYTTCNISALVEYCVFDNTCDCDNEVISVKSMNNVIRYNTFSNNLGAYVSFNNGNNNIAYGNYHINSGGVIFKQASNVSVYNCYFFQCDIPLCFVDVSRYADLHPDYQTLYHSNINIQNNTFYNCNSLLIDKYRGAGNNVLANNIIYQDGEGLPIWQTNTSIYTGYVAPHIPAHMPLILGNISGFSVLNNLILPITPNQPTIAWNPVIQTDGAGKLLTDASGYITIPGFIQANPEFHPYGSVPAPDNYYTLSASSPAIGASGASPVPVLTNPFVNDTDASLTLDITGQTRVPSPNDVGCAQFTTAASGLPVNRPLKIADVGIQYNSA